MGNNVRSAWRLVSRCKKREKRVGNREHNADPSLGSDGFLLAGRSFTNGLTSPQLFADDAVSDDKSRKRSNVVDNE